MSDNVRETENWKQELLRVKNMWLVGSSFTGIYNTFINGGRAEQPGFECLNARLGKPGTDHKTTNMASFSRASDENACVILTEDDIPGASLAGRNPSSLKNEELRFWLRCQGDLLKGLKTKAQLVKR